MTALNATRHHVDDKVGDTCRLSSTRYRLKQKMKTLFLLVLSLHLDLDLCSAQETSCQVCTLGPDVIPLPGKDLPPNIPLPLTNCFDVQVVSNLLAPDSDLCRTAQSLGTYCGCNRAADACNLCWDGSTPANKDREQTTYDASSFLGAIGSGVKLNCETLEAFLHSITNTSNQCLETQATVGEDCGCPPLPGDSALDTYNMTNTTGIVSNSTEPETEDNGGASEQQSEYQNVCTLCANGEAVPFPDKVPLVIGNVLPLTCSEWESLALTSDEGSDDCRLVRSVSLICGCERPAEGCRMCPLGESVPKASQQLTWLGENFLSSSSSSWFFENTAFFTCALMESIVASEPTLLAGALSTDEGMVCTAAQMKSWICGCEQDWRPIFLTWAYRLSAMLSFMGSIAIVMAIMRKQDNRWTAYNQLVLGISVFDMVSSLAYVLVGVLAPYEAGFYLSRGNDETCELQGFMIQLGQTASMLYNLFLALYFFLVVLYGWRERRFKKMILWVHVGVVGMGLAMAGGSIPFVVAQFGVCGILPPLTAAQWQVSLFYTMPVSIVLLVLTTATASICWKVYSQSKKASKWMAGKSLAITKKVFWQSFWYVMAFYVTLPFVLLSFYLPYDSPDDFWIFAVTAVLAPLQGFMNAFVYFQRNKGLVEILVSLYESLSASLSATLKRCLHSTQVKMGKKKSEPESFANNVVKLTNPSDKASSIQHSAGESEVATAGVLPSQANTVVTSSMVTLQSSFSAESKVFNPKESTSTIESRHKEWPYKKEATVSSPKENPIPQDVDVCIDSEMPRPGGTGHICEPPIPGQEDAHDDESEGDADNHDNRIRAAVLEYWKLNETTSDNNDESTTTRRKSTIAFGDNVHVAMAEDNIGSGGSSRNNGSFRNVLQTISEGSRSFRNLIGAPTHSSARSQKTSDSDASQDPMNCT